MRKRVALVVLAALAVLSVAMPTAAQARASIRGRIVAEGATGPLVAYLEYVRGAKPPRSAKPKASMVQQDTEFVPRALVVRKGERVRFPNKDSVYHNVFSMTPGNEFDLGMFRGGEARTVKMRRPGEVDVYCNIHPNMAAKILVLQNPHYAFADAQGAFEIPRVPKGRYVLVAWSAGHEPQRRTIVVADEDLRVELALEPRASSRAHVNKHGEAYGRYK